MTASVASSTPHLTYRTVEVYQPDLAGSEAKRFLSDFQRQKIGFMFDFFFDEGITDGYMEQVDFDHLAEKVRKYLNWTIDSKEYIEMVDLNRNFFENLKEQTANEAGLEAMEQVTKVGRSQFINMFARLGRNATSIMSYPIWVQLLPRMMFRIMDKDGDGIVKKHELRNFYENFMMITDDLSSITDCGFNAMTADGDAELDYHMYTMNFTNFLLGKNEYGPGKYIFGTFGCKEYTSTYKPIYTD